VDERVASDPTSTNRGKATTARPECPYAGERGVPVSLSDVNKNPRRWVDESRRVRVVEGWHPSQPSAVGFNVKVDADWIGMFSTLDEAADAAATCLEVPTSDVVLRLQQDRPGDAYAAGHLHLVRPTRPDADE